MHPYLPFAAIPIAVTAAWFAASHWSGSEPGRYRVPPVAQIEAPSVPAAMNNTAAEPAEIRVAAFLPQSPPRPPAPVSTLILHSVMTGSDVDLATINGRVVRVGDRIEGYLVRSITSDGVELSAGNRSRRLTMRPLHELPPPGRSGTMSASLSAGSQEDDTNPARNLWATYSSP